MKPEAIDALVAQHIFGARPPIDADAALALLKEAAPDEMLASRVQRVVGLAKPIYPPYSASVEHAWDVVDEMADQGFYYNISRPYDRETRSRYHYVFFGKPASPEPIADARAETAPLAICLAAMKAKGVELPSMEGGV